MRPIDADTADAPGLLLAGAAFPSKLFDVTAEKDGWLRLTPRQKDSGLGAVRLKLAGDSMQALQLEDGLGQTTRIDLLDPQRNGTLPAARFTFKPPPGVDVIRALPQPVIGRISDGVMLLDLRCLEDEDGFCAQIGRSASE